MKNDLKMIATRVSPETKEALRLLAVKNDRSLAEELRLLVEKRIDQFEKEVLRAG